MIKGKAEIRFICGDSYQKNVIIENVDKELIEAVYFSSEKLGLCKELEYISETNKFRFYLPREETATFEKGVYDYDITIKFINNVVKTIPYRSYFVVLPKVNKVGCMQ